MISSASHRVRPVFVVAIVSLLYVSFSGGCLRKWMAKREAARETARLAESEQTQADADAGSLGPPASTGVDGAREDEATDGNAPGSSSFAGVVGLSEVGDPGLEVAVWTCDDTGFGAARVLAGYADRPVPISEAQRAAWQRRGLRFVAVPIGEIDTLARATRPMSPVQRQRFGQLTTWSAVVRGPRIPVGSTGPRGAIPSGKPRLIARAWIEPDLSSGEMRRVVRIEAGVQIEKSRSTEFLRDSDELRSVSDDGVLIDGLLVSFVADGRNAIVLVGESPAIDWATLPGVLASSDSNDESAQPGANPTRPGVGGMGPGEPAGRSLGERMLAAEAIPARNGRPGAPPRKVLVVLIPRVQAGAVGGVNDAVPAVSE